MDDNNINNTITVHLPNYNVRHIYDNVTGYISNTPILILTSVLNNKNKKNIKNIKNKNITFVFSNEDEKNDFIEKYELVYYDNYSELNKNFYLLNGRHTEEDSFGGHVIVDNIKKYSNPAQAQKMAYKYLGKKNGKLFRSTKKEKKYMIMDPKTGKWTHFGQMGYEDYTKHKDKKRRHNYLTRTAKMRGHWKNNKYSANNLARNVLW
jgi:hypothetical protein